MLGYINRNDLYSEKFVSIKHDRMSLHVYVGDSDKYFLALIQAHDYWPNLVMRSPSEKA